jgi:hypothetical protein
MGKANDLKMFTVEEANQLLPRLSEWIQDLQSGRNMFLGLEVEFDAIELVAEKDDSGSSPALERKVEEYTRLVNRFYSRVDEIHGAGCLLKDLDRGLVDFYSLQNNRVVFLCWKLGEPSIGFWHDINTGFASRQNL